MTGVDFLLANCSEIVSPIGGGHPLRGPQLGRLKRVERAALVARNGVIVDWGPERQVLGRIEKLPGCVEVDAGGCSVIPGLVDPHTHAVFGRARPEEYAARIEGRSYVEIAAAGGGIHSSVRDLRSRSEDELLELTVPRLLRMLAHGTTTLEIKSGYGLTTEDELKTLRVIRRLSDRVPQTLVATFLGAHEMPLDFRDRRQEYMELVIEEMIPLAAELADFNDVFCEPSVFTLEESERVLRAGARHGLAPKLHADELESCGAAELGCRLGAVSADHLVRVSEAGVRALADSDTVAVLLPGTSFGLALPDYAPARKLIEAGAIVALATDFNPGSSHGPSMQATWSLACSMMRMTPDEALTACTLNAAHAVGKSDTLGSLEPGRRCDLVVTHGSDYRAVPYHFGVNNARLVVQNGRVVWSDRETEQ
ncbi:MAG: imidazolonepropionase [Candidatus Krumholzibacteriia bacterium]